MTDLSIPVGSGGRPPANSTSYNPTVGTSRAGNFPPGTPVAPSPDADGSVVPATAHDPDVALCVGISTGTGVVGSRCLVEFSGVVSLTQAEWDAVIQSAPGGGLTRGTIYFLASDFSAEAGRLSATAPSLSGDFVLPLGIALSSTDLLVQIGTRSRNS